MKHKIIKFSSENSLNLAKDLSVTISGSSNPFDTFNGYKFAVVTMSQDAPHDGEMHPNGDEIIFLISGHLDITLEYEEPQVVSVTQGKGIVIPKGIWHKVRVIEPAHMVTLTPGPDFMFRQGDKEISRSDKL